MISGSISASLAINSIIIHIILFLVWASIAVLGLGLQFQVPVY